MCSGSVLCMINFRQSVGGGGGGGGGVAVRRVLHSIILRRPALF